RRPGRMRCSWGSAWGGRPTGRVGGSSGAPRFPPPWPTRPGCSWARAPTSTAAGRRASRGEARGRGVRGRTEAPRASTRARGPRCAAATTTARLAWGGEAGVISRTGAPYSVWWNGGLRATTCFHNMIGMLTEAFGHPEPTELRQGIGRRLGNGDYPMPVATRMWHARDTIEYLQTANFAILDTAARYRTRLLTNFGRMAVASIERGSRDHWTPTPRLLALAQAAARDARRPAAADERSVTAANDGGDAPRRVGRGR